MAAGDLIQVGTVLEVGLAGFAYAKIEITSVTGPTRMADKSESKDAAQGATRTRFFKNPRRTLQFSGLILNSASHAEIAAIEALKPSEYILLPTAGTAASRTNENWILEDGPKVEKGEANGNGMRVSFDCSREDSMASTYGTT